MNDIEINSSDWPEDVVRLILLKSNQWDCSPNEALKRILEERAKKSLARAQLLEKKLALK